MKKTTAVLLAFLVLPTMAAAQTFSPNFLRREAITDRALTYFVSTTGSDSNTCTTVGSPCLTVQKAISKIPRIVRHPVSITLAAGTYTTGFVVDGFSFEPYTNPTNGAYVNIEGTLINATPATGTATGTATAGTAGTPGSTTWGTLTDSGQAWTVNDLRGKLIEITGGTGSGQIRSIDSNTATSITIAGTWTAPVNGSSTYAIRDWGTILTGAIATPANIRDAAAANTSTILIGSNQSSLSGPYSIGIQKMKFASAGSGNGVQLRQGQQALLRYNNFSISGGNAVNLVGDGALGLYYNTANLVAGGVWILSQGTWVTGGFIDGNVVVGGSTGFRFNSVDQVILTNTAIRNVSGDMIRWSRSTNLTLSALILDTSSGGFGIDSDNNSAASAMGVLRITASTISGCASGGVRQNGVGLLQMTNVTGTNTGPGITVINGGRVQISSATAVTGSSDISVDSSTLTYAALRALSPKQSTNTTTLSTIWE